MKLFKTLAVSAAVALASTAGVTNAGTLQDVKSAGELKCVVTTGVPGFGAPDDSETKRGSYSITLDFHLTPGWRPHRSSIFFN